MDTNPLPGPAADAADAAGPQPEPDDIEGAHLLANEARGELGEDGLSDAEIDELADEFVILRGADDTEDFERWAETRHDPSSGTGEPT